ncbi:MAG TPA: SprB repeat-containing protein [Polyangiaceae bacterium]|jgi:hypothetical protein
MQLKPLPGRRWFAARGAALVLSAGLIGCGASGSGVEGEVGTYEPDAAGEFSGGSDASSSNGPDAQIDQSHVAVDIVTVTCSGGCADVQAVATGGQPPYSFVWNDGSTTASRHLCPTASQTYEVTVTDAGRGGESPRGPETAQATLAANALACLDGGASPASGDARDGGAGTLCVTNPSFEGTAQIDVADIVAPPWQTCDDLPDVLDGKVGGDTLQPSDGMTYLDLQYNPSASSVSESVGQELCAPLRAGETAYVKIDVARQTGAFGSFTVQFFGATTACKEDQLLGETAPVTNVGAWTTACVTLHAQSDATFLKLRLGGGQSTTLGLMGFIDNLRPVSSCP